MRSGFVVHTMHHFVLPKVRLIFSQRTCPIDFFRHKTKFLGGFAQFRCREVQVVRSGFRVHKMHHFVLPKWRLVFSQRTCPIDFFRPKTRDGNSTRGCGYPRILNPMDAGAGLIFHPWVDPHPHPHIAGAGADLRFHPRVDPHPSEKKINLLR